MRWCVHRWVGWVGVEVVCVLAGGKRSLCHWVGRNRCMWAGSSQDLGGLGEVVRVNDSVVTCSCNHTSERGAYPKGFTKLPWPRRWHGGPLHVSIMMLFSSPGSFALTRWDSHKRTKEENTYWPVWPDQNQQKSPKHCDSR